MEKRSSRSLFLSKSGFTLIELLVVVLIVSILAAVALPQYNKVVKKAQGAEALTIADALDKAMRTYYLEHGTYLGVSAEKLNMEIPASQHVRYAKSAGSFDFSEGTLTPTFFNEHYIEGSPYSVRLLFPTGKNYLYMSWDNKGELLSKSCGVYGGGTRTSCAEYFNCDAEPIQIVSTGSSSDVIGGDCNLK